MMHNTQVKSQRSESIGMASYVKALGLALSDVTLYKLTCLVHQSKTIMK